MAEITFKGVGHLIPMEVVDKTADAVTGWVAPELERWQQIEDAERAEWSQVPMHMRSQFSEEFKRTMTGDWVNEVKGQGTNKPSKL